MLVFSSNKYFLKKASFLINFVFLKNNLIFSLKKPIKTKLKF